MARKTRHSPLAVYLNGRHVGRLRRQPSGAIDFAYTDAWLSWENALPVSLSLPLREDRYVGAPVVAVFDNLLPDNKDIRSRIAARLDADGTDAFDLLAVAGRDCVGALQFLPEGESPEPIGSITGEPITPSGIDHLISALGVNPLGMTEESAFRISIAGAQEKTALLRWQGKWLKPLGTTPTTHILKPQIGVLPSGIDLLKSVENEYFCLSLLAALGLPTAEVEMGTFGQNRALVVKRFDRRVTADNRILRLPQEDLCQALSISPAKKYEAEGGPGMSAILKLLAGSDTPLNDQKTFLKACISFWLIGATDGHAKNFSIFLRPGNSYAMTPIYDVLSAQPNLDLGQIRRNQMKLAMAVGNNRHTVVETIAGRHFIETAKTSGVDPALVPQIFDELNANLPLALASVTGSLPSGFPPNISDSITKAALRRMRLMTAP